MNSVLPQQTYSDALSPAESCSCQLAGREEEGVADVQKGAGVLSGCSINQTCSFSAMQGSVLNAEKSDGNMRFCMQNFQTQIADWIKFPFKSQSHLCFHHFWEYFTDYIYYYIILTLKFSPIKSALMIYWPCLSPKVAGVVSRPQWPR